MKNSILLSTLPILSLLLFIGADAIAQPVVDLDGDGAFGTLAADPSAILDLASNEKGLLLPRMITVERNAIANPAEGLVIYNTDLGTFQIWSDASGTWQWDAVQTTGTNLYWNTIGNGGLTDGIDNLLGTLDPVRVRMIVDGTEQLVLNTNGSIQRDLGGDPRGTDAVDLQIGRNNAEEVASGTESTIGGGRDNRVAGDRSAIAGGQGNVITDRHSTIAGGQGNTITDRHSTIGGGQDNDISDFYSTIAGGQNNRVPTDYSTIGGGQSNVADGDRSTIAGGTSNRTEQRSTTVGGGRENLASGEYATVAGGRFDTASGASSTVGGGFDNDASGDYSTVSGGFENRASEAYGTIGGGQQHLLEAQYGTIGGGQFNRITGLSFYSTIAGGRSNQIDRGGSIVRSSTIAGGLANRIERDFSAIPGGRGLTLAGGNSFGFLGGNTNVAAAPNAGQNNMRITAANTALFGNVDLWLANNNSTASKIRFYEAKAGNGTFPAGANYTSFEAGAQASDINYILPTTTSATATIEDGILQLDQGTGQLSWVDPAALGVPAWALVGNAGTTPGPEYVGTSDAQALHIYVNGGTDNSLVLNTNGSIQHGTGGNARGEDAVDLQSARTAANQVASGRWSTIVGGYQNMASGDYSVAMGRLATASGPFSIAMGQSARATGGGGIAIGGIAQASGGESIAIGNNARATGSYSYALGRNALSTNDYAMTFGASSSATRFGAIAMGVGLTVQGNSSFGFLANTTTFARPMQINAAEVAAFGNTDLWLANNNNSASQLRFYEANGTTGLFPNGTNFTSFRAGVQASNINYTLPTAAPAAGAGNLGGGLMEATSGGTMSWRGAAVGSAALNFPNTAAGGASDLTITVNGAVVGDMVLLGAPNAGFPSGANANEHYTAWISAANTVTVRYHNNTGAAATPAAATFSVMVIRP